MRRSCWCPCRATQVTAAVKTQRMPPTPGSLASRSSYCLISIPSKKSLKDLCFNANIRNIRCLNLGGLVEDDNNNWGEDPVHPKPDCYGRIATKIIHEAAMLLQAGKSTSRNQPSATERNTKRSSSTEDGNCSKRQRSSAAGQPISNPHQWTSSAPSFARGHGRGQLTWRGSQEARRWTSGRGYRGRWPRKPRGAHYSRW